MNHSCWIQIRFLSETVNQFSEEHAKFLSNQSDFFQKAVKGNYVKQAVKLEFFKSIKLCH